MTSSNPALLYSYFRSSCSWRVRIALEHKKIPYNIIPINLLKGEQKSTNDVESDGYMDIQNPSGLVPTLDIDGFKLSQSLAILEYLDEREIQQDSDSKLKNQTLLLPSFTINPRERFLAREITHIIGCDTQPVQNLGVLQDVQKIANIDSMKEVTQRWGAPVIRRGFSAVERLVMRNRDRITLSGINNHEAGSNSIADSKFLLLNQMTIADIAIVCQCANAIRFGIDLDSEFPIIGEVYRNMMSVEAVSKTRPENQVDAV